MALSLLDRIEYCSRCGPTKSGQGFTEPKGRNNVVRSRCVWAELARAGPPYTSGDATSYGMSTSGQVSEGQAVAQPQTTASSQTRALGRVEGAVMQRSPACQIRYSKGSGWGCNPEAPQHHCAVGAPLLPRLRYCGSTTPQAETEHCGNTKTSQV